MNKSKIAIIGIGKLGLCLALNLERKGYHILGVDVNEHYLQQIDNKSLQSSEPMVMELLKNSQNLTTTTQLNNLIAYEPHCIFVVVSTPSLSNGKYDHSIIESLVKQLLALPKPTHTTHFVINSTVMPGYTATVAQRLNPHNYEVIYNPEFIAQGRIIRDQLQPDQVLIGADRETAAQAVADVYRTLCENEPTYCIMSPISAEICKIATNCFLTTKISFANSIGDLALTVNAEPDKILAAIGADRRVGPQYLRYGFGYGGPCLPRDNRALGVFAEEAGMELLLSTTTDEVNRRHLDFQVQQYLQQHPVTETIIFNTVTYNALTPSIIESQQLALAVRLATAGRKVLVRDAAEVIKKVKVLYGDLMQYEVIC